MQRLPDLLERRCLLPIVLDAVHVGARDTNPVVAIRPKAASDSEISNPSPFAASLAGRPPARRSQTGSLPLVHGLTPVQAPPYVDRIYDNEAGAPADETNPNYRKRLDTGKRCSFKLPQGEFHDASV